MSDYRKEFSDYMRGPGASMLGGLIKAAAKAEQRRLKERLATPNLFPHLEHEDRNALMKAERAEAEGARMVEKCRRRQKIVKKLLK